MVCWLSNWHNWDILQSLPPRISSVSEIVFAVLPLKRLFRVLHWTMKSGITQLNPAGLDQSKRGNHSGIFCLNMSVWIDFCHKSGLIHWFSVFWNNIYIPKSLEKLLHSPLLLEYLFILRYFSVLVLVWMEKTYYWLENIITTVFQDVVVCCQLFPALWEPTAWFIVDKH